MNFLAKLFFAPTVSPPPPVIAAAPRTRATVLAEAIAAQHQFDEKYRRFAAHIHQTPENILRAPTCIMGSKSRDPIGAVLSRETEEARQRKDALWREFASFPKESR